MLIVPIDNYQQYESKLKFFMSTVMTAGASVFRGLEEENVFDIEESKEYDNLTDQMLEDLLTKPEILYFEGKNTKYHVNKDAHNPETHV